MRRSNSAETSLLAEHGPLFSATVRLTCSFSCAAALTAALLAACGGAGDGDVCANSDGALSNAGLVVVEDPKSGERVSSGLRVSGCSSTFEASVNWRLRDRAGKTLASGVTQGGSLEPSSFEFTVEYSIATRQIGELQVYEPRITTEGFPPSRDVVPLVLEPSGQ
jgi:hypothetical protein